MKALIVSIFISWLFVSKNATAVLPKDIENSVWHVMTSLAMEKWEVNYAEKEKVVENISGVVMPDLIDRYNLQSFQNINAIRIEIKRLVLGYLKRWEVFQSMETVRLDDTYFQQ